VAFRVPN